MKKKKITILWHFTCTNILTNLNYVLHGELSLIKCQTFRKLMSLLNSVHNYQYIFKTVGSVGHLITITFSHSPTFLLLLFRNRFPLLGWSIGGLSSFGLLIYSPVIKSFSTYNTSEDARTSNKNKYSDVFIRLAVMLPIATIAFISLHHEDL